MHLYIHIPFCERICIYCDFYVTTARKWFEPLSQAIVTEFNRFGETIGEIPTIYFGGGTPSYWPANFLDDAIRTIRSLEPQAGREETSLEANPNNITDENLGAWLRMGFDRISIGVQSFQGEELNFLTRNHNADMAAESVTRARKAGFKKISLDLMFGLQEQTLDSWRSSLETACRLRPDHISLYSLTVEERTFLYKMVSEGKTKLPDDELELAMYETAIEFLAQEGFRQYEISNFAKPGFESVHNRAYWQNKPYLGLGPSAHSFDGEKRWWNVRDVKTYCDKIAGGASAVSETEMLNEAQKKIEFLFLSFRQTNGIDPLEYRKRFSENFEDRFRPALVRSKPFLEIDQSRVRLNRRGLFLYNKICSEFVSLI